VRAKRARDWLRQAVRAGLIGLSAHRKGEGMAPDPRERASSVIFRAAGRAGESFGSEPRQCLTRPGSVSQRRVYKFTTSSHKDSLRSAVSIFVLSCQHYSAAWRASSLSACTHIHTRVRTGVRETKRLINKNHEPELQRGKKRRRRPYRGRPYRGGRERERERDGEVMNGDS